MKILYFLITILGILKTVSPEKKYLAAETNYFAGEDPGIAGFAQGAKRPSKSRHSQGRSPAK